MFKLEIRTDNAAFEERAEEEVARILEEVAKRLRAGHSAGKCIDANGNSVGCFGFDEELIGPDSPRRYKR